jgi:glycine/D-amino acid oxidase-like deaminating enzyme
MPGIAEPSASLIAPISADLAVVGGSYLGLWTAVLAKRRNPGQKVVLLEAQRVGWAASGRNGGFCEASITHGEENGRSRWPDEYETLDRLGEVNLNEFEKDIDDLGIECHWERTGTLRVAVEPHQTVGWARTTSTKRPSVGISTARCSWQVASTWTGAR